MHNNKYDYINHNNDYIIVLKLINVEQDGAPPPHVDGHCYA